MSALRAKKSSVELSVELGATEDAERDDVEPEEQGDAGAERAVDLGVVGEARDIPAKDESGKEPHDRGDDSTGEYALPGLLHGRSHVIDEADDADTADEFNAPADEESEDVDRSAGQGHKVEGRPLGHEMAENDENAGKCEGNQRERNEQECSATALPEGPTVHWEVVGATNAFHQSSENAGGSDEADQESDDEGVGRLDAVR